MIARAIVRIGCAHRMAPIVLRGFFATLFCSICIDLLCEIKLFRFIDALEWIL